MIDEYEALKCIEDAIALLKECNASPDIISGLEIAKRIIERISPA